MSDIDLNLLIALDALLAEGSVAGAARCLGLSASAMSRTLARLRAASGRGEPKPDKDVRALREGTLDLEIGVLGRSGPEVRLQALFRDYFVGAVRNRHPLLDEGELTPERCASFGHVVASRRGAACGPVDHALSAVRLRRRVVAVVPSLRAALAVAGKTDLALVSNSFVQSTLGGQTPSSATSIRSFPLPVHTEAITVSQMWHPRFDVDPAHRWLRGLVSTCCRQQGADRSAAV